MWNFLGARPVDVFSWESFGEGWATDITKQLKLADVRHIKAGYGELPDLSQWNPQNDIVFTWNGTTSGVKVPNGDWIPADRAGPDPFAHAMFVLAVLESICYSQNGAFFFC